MSKQITLGKEVRDRVSGYKGIAISRTVYLQGCSRVGVQPKVRSGGELPEPKDFDEPDLVEIGPGVFDTSDKEESGGPRFMPSKKR